MKGMFPPVRELAVIGQHLMAGELEESIFMILCNSDLRSCGVDASGLMSRRAHRTAFR